MPDQLLAITIPPGMSAGQALTVQAPDGQRLQITIPPGMGPGQQLQVAIPPSAPPPPPAPPPAVAPPRRFSNRGAPAGIELSDAGKKTKTLDQPSDSKIKTLRERCRAANVRVSNAEVEAALKEMNGHVGRAFGKLTNSAFSAAAPAPAPGLPRPSFTPNRTGLAGMRPAAAKQNANVPFVFDHSAFAAGYGDGSIDPLADLLYGEGLRPTPKVYADTDRWLRETARRLKERLAWDDDFKPPKVDVLESTSNVPKSTGYISPGERAPIASTLRALEGDATSNVKLRALMHALPQLPSTLSRTQAEAIMRCFDVVMRRVQALSLIRDRIDPVYDEWAAEIEDGATATRIRELVGDQAWKPPPMPKVPKAF